MQPEDVLKNLKQGDHLCFFYESEKEQTALLSPFIRQGLETGDKVIYIGNEGTDFLFRGTSFHPDPFLKSRQLVLISWNSLKKNEMFSLPDIFERIKAEMSSVVSENYSLRIAADTSSVLPDFDSEELISMERQFDSFFKEIGCIAFCQCNVNLMKIDFMMDLLIRHQVIMTGWGSDKNFHYFRQLSKEKENQQNTSLYLLRVLRERTAIEVMLARNEELFRKYIDIAGFFIVILDRAAKLRLINRKGIEITGYAPEELLGKNAIDQLISQREKENCMDFFKKIINQQTDQLYVEFPIVTKSGEERLIFWHYAVVLENKKVKHVLISGEDITSRVQNEQALKTSEALYRDLFEHAVEGIFQITPDGKFLNVNSAYAKMIGFQSPEEMIKKLHAFSKQHYVYPEQRKELLSKIEKQGIVRNFEAQVSRFNGEKIWISVTARSIRDADGKLQYYEGMVEDITSRKQSEEQLNKTLHNLRVAMEGAIHSIARTVEAKDPYTAGHQQRVGVLSRAIAINMDLSPDIVEGVYLAGSIHDLGKISIPAEFLAKPGKLTEYEFMLIKTHPDVGYKILRDIDFPWPVAEIVLQHHERNDGSGYPKGLKGDNILIEAKIIAVADVIETITFSRPYRPAYGLDLALQEIERNKDILFDSEVVNACVDLFRKEKFTWDHPGFA